MRAILRKKPILVLAITIGLAAIVFVAQAFFAPETAESKAIRDYALRYESASYTDPTYGFSISLPKDFIVSSSDQDDGELIIAEHPTFNLGLEAFISPFDSEGQLTVDTIRELNPALSIKEPVDMELPDGTPALRFASDDPALGDTRQLWFLHNGDLFQVVFYSANTEWLDAWVRAFPNDWTFTPPQTDSVL